MALTALTLTAFIAVIIGLKKPNIGLIGVGILCTLDPLSRVYLMTGGLLRWNLFNYWLLWAIAWNCARLMSVACFPVKVLRVFSAILILQLAISPDLEDGAQHCLNLLAFFGILAYFIRVNPLQAGITLGLVNGTLAAAGGLVFQLLRDKLPNINANAYAFFPLTALFSICLGVKAARHRRSISRWLHLMALMNAGWVFLTGSRGGMLIGLCCLIYIALMSTSPGQFAFVATIGWLSGMLIGSQFGESREYALQRIAKLLDSEESAAERTSGRSDIALAGYWLFLKHPFGVGTGGFSSAYGGLSMDRSLHRAGFEMAAHSGWVKVLAENGVLGAPVFVMFVLSFFLVGLQRDHRGMLPIGLLVSLTLVIVFVSQEFHGKGLWLFAAGGSTMLGTVTGRRRFFASTGTRIKRSMRDREREEARSLAR
ncbi:MAG: O-antigen ligase family protein [Acidobacteria bacterium]|nr:O-antigen ligase family protein [Acidobacteriota bacterium]